MARRTNRLSASSAAASSTSSSVPVSYEHDVFLNFRGEDTRSNFTGHLYTALRNKGIKTFIDDGLKRGEDISRALFKAIDESRMSVIVFSENYARSPWCLDELVKILGCRESKRQMVRPIFYKVKPSDVRHLRGIFGEALAQHELDFEHDCKIVRRWSAALSEAANLSGWPFMDENESQFIERVVKEIADQVLKPKSYLDKIRPLELPAVERPPRVLQVTWSCPYEGYLKINYDGAYTVRKGGLGAVARDAKGRFVAAKCSFVNVESEDEVVAMAALEAVCLAKELGWPRVCFEGDSLRVVNALQPCTDSDDHDSETFFSSSSFGQIISEIQSMSSRFQQSSFSHIHPKGNVVNALQTCTTSDDHDSDISSSSPFDQIISEIQSLSSSFQRSSFSLIDHKANVVAERLATHALSNPKEKHWVDKPPEIIEYSISLDKYAASQIDK